MVHIIFWVSSFLVFFIYLGYGVFLYVLLKLRNLFMGAEPKLTVDEAHAPTVAVLIAAYNEEKVIYDKIINTKSLQYPAGKLKIYVVADGSNDGTASEVQRHPDVELLYTPERKGKSAAINRAMPLIKEDITIYTDANTLLNTDAIMEIVSRYSDKKVGAVSGEKRIATGMVENAAGTEGVYWKYESSLKKLDADLNTLVGAAGELFSIRTALYKTIPADTLLDDFIISFNIIRQGYKVDYAPNAYAYEAPSSDIVEEYNRKVRIAAGGIQSVVRLPDLLNFFKYGFTTFQYFFHRAMRWFFAPSLLILAFVSNIVLSLYSDFYRVLLVAQILFYLAAWVGYMLQKRSISFKLTNVIYYFVFMHWCVLLGTIRYFTGKQSTNWKKGARVSLSQVGTK